MFFKVFGIMGLFLFYDKKFWSLRWYVLCVCVYVCVYCAEGTGLFVAWSAGAGRFLWTRKKVFIKITVHWLQWNPLRLLLLRLLPLVLVIIAKEQETERVGLWTECERDEKKKKNVRMKIGGVGGFRFVFQFYPWINFVMTMIFSKSFCPAS